MLINNSTEQLIQGILRHGPDILEHCQTSDDLSQLRSDGVQILTFKGPDSNKLINIPLTLHNLRQLL